MTAKFGRITHNKKTSVFHSELKTWLFGKSFYTCHHHVYLHMTIENFSMHMTDMRAEVEYTESNK